MISKLFGAGALAVAIVAFTPAANAAGVDKDGGFYATPVQKGAPRDLPGEAAIPGVVPLVDVIDGVTRPILVDPIQGLGAGLVIPGLEPAAAPGPAAAPMMRKRHRMMAHRHMMKHHMMKKKMMKKM